jgi:hypothetical protein
MDKQVPQAFSPQDMARRRRRSVVMAIALAALMILFFVTTIVRLGGAVAERTL